MTEEHAEMRHKGWRILPIAIPVDTHFTARYELHREPQEAVFIPVTTWHAPGEFPSKDDALRGAVWAAIEAIESQRP